MSAEDVNTRGQRIFDDAARQIRSLMETFATSQAARMRHSSIATRPLVSRCVSVELSFSCSGVCYCRPTASRCHYALCLCQTPPHRDSRHSLRRSAGKTSKTRNHGSYKGASIFVRFIVHQQQKILATATTRVRQDMGASTYLPKLSWWHPLRPL